MKKHLLVWLSGLSLLGAFGACDSDEGAVQDTGDTSDTSDTADTADTNVTPHPALDGTTMGGFVVRPGVETVTVVNATIGSELTLYDAAGERLVTVPVDAFGQAHIAYLPATYGRVDLNSDDAATFVQDSNVVPPGDGYLIRDDTAEVPEASEVFSVMAVSDVPDEALYTSQTLTGIHFGITEQVGDQGPGFNYIEMRDGVKLSAMVRFPNASIWGDGPYPTLVEYSGYSPSDPGGPDAGSRIATLLGFATVGVNMRGSGCSGGVFDVFNPAQHADGYDVIETLARQSWAKGGRIGMIGLSYSGITQLYVAHTRPPSLAAITPLSVIADSWLQLWPGGIYNNGFTEQWLAERDRDAAPSGLSWTETLIEEGDTVCEGHQQLRFQNIAFERFFQTLEFYPKTASARSLPILVRDIDVPVFLTGAFQDEQTGTQFAEMLDQFESVPGAKFTLFNGRHVDGYSPLVLTRWWEFLKFYVDGTVPRMPAFVRDLAGPELSKQFNADNLGFEPDRFTDFEDTDHAGALASYEAEANVRVLFENGAGNDQPGAPIHRFEATYSSWPPPNATEKRFLLTADSALLDSTDDDASALAEGRHRFLHDPEAGAMDFFGPKGYQLLVRIWDIDWTEFPAERAVSYMTAPLTEAVVVAGPSYAQLWIESDVDEVALQVTLTEVRPDDTEYLLQSGWLRLGHESLSADPASPRELTYDFLETGFNPWQKDTLRKVRVALASLAHALRVGTRLRMTVSTPGRNHGTWTFRNPDHSGHVGYEVAVGGPSDLENQSALVLSVVDDVDIVGDFPPCPALRGQPCRTFTARTNTVVEAK